MTGLFAWRYFKSKKSTNSINVISWISVVAIAIVTAALIVVLSVFNGFETLVKNLYSDFYPDVLVAPVKGKWMQADAAFLSKIAQAEGVQSVEPIVEERGIIIDEGDKSIVWLKGVQPGYQTFSGLGRHMANGEFAIGDTAQPGLVLGVGVESALQVVSGKAMYPVTVYLPNRLAENLGDPLQALHSANAYPTGSFIIQQEFDNNYAFTNLAFMQYMLDLPANEYSRLELKLTPGADADRAAARLQKIVGSQFMVKTRYAQNQSLFAAMQIEKLIIFAVAFLILLIAAFNIMSTLTMMVLEKQKDIAVLRAMGTPGGSIQAIFLKMGVILGALGALSGLVLGAVICLGQQQWHWVKLGGQSFIIDYYPVEMRWLDFVAVVAIILVIILLAAILPSRKIRLLQTNLRANA